MGVKAGGARSHLPHHPWLSEGQWVVLPPPQVLGRSTEGGESGM